MRIKKTYQKLCKLCNERREGELKMTGGKLFLRYLDDIVRTVKGDPSVVLHAAITLQPNLKFTLETTNENSDLAFLHFKKNLDGNR